MSRRDTCDEGVQDRRCERNVDLGALRIAGGRACSTSTRLTHPVIPTRQAHTLPSGVLPERDRPLPITLAEDPNHLVVKVDVRDPHAGNLGKAGTRVDEDHHDGRVAACREVFTGAGSKQPLECVVR